MKPLDSYHLKTLIIDTYRELKEADRVICELCKRLNPHHATADYGKGCEWCQERNSRLQTLVFLEEVQK